MLPANSLSGHLQKFSKRPEERRAFAKRLAKNIQYLAGYCLCR
jgi:hypothetical protein